MPSPPPALPWLLAACCLCALPRGSGFPQPFSRHRDGAELPPNQVRLSLSLPGSHARWRGRAETGQVGNEARLWQGNKAANRLAMPYSIAGGLVQRGGRLAPFAARSRRWNRYGQGCGAAGCRIGHPAQQNTDGLVTNQSRLPEQKHRYEGMMDALLISILYFLKQLALCFSQWKEMSDQPQISSTVLDLCYSIFNSMHKNEDSHGPLGRPFFLFRPRNGRTIEGSEYRGM
uniref:Neuromedin S n=1 Tax=Cyanistes caeruleus TaxID=156563 RepID=A0A8C0VGL3_CYACU